MEKNAVSSKKQNLTFTKISDILNSGESGENYCFNKNKPVLICSECGEPLGLDIDILGKRRRVPRMCKCAREKVEEYKKNEKRKEIECRLNHFRSYSLMDNNFKDSTFENWKFKDDNKNMYALGKSYCENWKTMKENNRCLLIWGKAGNGKTYLSFAIANELYKKDVSVLAISVGKILSMIQETYRNENTIGEIDILKTLNDVELLILDDLGTESRTKWSYDKLYSVIDGRCRSKRPMIITTNLDEQEFRKNLAVMDFKTNYIDNSERIYNRLVGVCAILEIKGSSWRVMQGMKNKADLFRELGMTDGVTSN